MKGSGVPMLEQDTIIEERETGLSAILVKILESEDRGEAGRPDRWLDRYPQFRHDLEEFFGGQEAISVLLDEATPVSDIHFPGYTVVRELGRGGNAVVFEALQHNPPRLVALKALFGAHLLSIADRKRFELEVRTSASLDHPNILPVYESGESNGVPFFTMKLAAGGPLSRSLGRYRDDPRAAALLVHSLAQAIHFAHQRGLLHRDLKPSNILLDENGIGYVADFGLVRDASDPDALTGTRELIGTLQYLAPECTAGRGQSTVSMDIYGLGCILYACLTGRAPFEGGNEAATLLKVRNALPTPPASLNPKVPRDLDAVCRMCLEKEPARRYESAAELAKDLENVLENRSTRAHPPGPVRKLASWMRRHPAATVAASLAILFLASASVALAVHEARLSDLNEDLQNTNRELGGVVAELKDRNQELDQERQTLRAREADLRRQTHVDRLRYAATVLEGFSRDEAVKVLEDCLPEERALGGPSFTWKYLWQEAQQEFASISVPEGEAFSVEFSPDGKWFATGDQRGNLRIYDCASFELIKHFTSTMGDVRDIAFRPSLSSYSHVAAVGEYASPFRWHVQSGQHYGEPLLLPNGGIAIEFGAETSTVVSVGVDGIAFVRPLFRGPKRLVRVCPEGDTVRTAAIFPDKKLVVVTTAKEQYPIFTDLDTEIQYRPWGWFRIARVERTQDDQLVLIGGVDIPFGWRVDPFNAYHETAVHTGPWGIRVQAAADSSIRVVAGGSADGIIEIQHSKYRNIIARFAAHNGKIRKLAFHPNCRILASAGADGKVRFWDADAIFRRYWHWSHWVQTDALAFHPLRPKDLVAGTRERIVIRNPFAGRTISRSNSHAENCFYGSPLQLAISPDGKMIFGATNVGPISRFDSNSLRSDWFSESFVGASGVALSPDGSILWARHMDDYVRGYDAETGNTKDEWFAGNDGTGPVSVHPGGKYLAVRAKRGHVHIFDTKGNLFASYPGHGHGGDAHTFSPDGRILAAVEGPTVELWDWEHKRKLRELSDGGAKYTCLAFSPDGLELATGNMNGSISLWRVNTGQKLMTLRNPGKAVQALAFNAKGDGLAVSLTCLGGSSEVRLYNGAPMVGVKPFRPHPPGFPHIPPTSPAIP
jgi:eukaryotic-like serine/threonine-protein kinase